MLSWLPDENYGPKKSFFEVDSCMWMDTALKLVGDGKSAVSEKNETERFGGMMSPYDEVLIWKLMP